MNTDDQLVSIQVSFKFIYYDNRFNQSLEGIQSIILVCSVLHSEHKEPFRAVVPTSLEGNNKGHKTNKAKFYT